MKVIFLDFDGVLTTAKRYGVLDSEKMELLIKILEATNAFIVISSSCREDDLDSTILKLTGGTDNYKKTSMRWLDKVIGVTPRPYIDDFICYDDWNREEEIRRYLEDHPEIDKFIILDDMEDEFVNDQFLGRLIKTSIKTGITIEDVNKAIRLLNDE